MCWGINIDFEHALKITCGIRGSQLIRDANKEIINLGIVKYNHQFHNITLKNTYEMKNENVVYKSYYLIKHQFAFNFTQKTII